MNKPIKFACFKNYPTNKPTLRGTHLKEMAKTSNAAFMKARKSLVIPRCYSIKGETCQLKQIPQNAGNIFFLKFLPTPKLIRRVKEQQSCLWPTFYQMDLMKGEYMLVKVD